VFLLHGTPGSRLGPSPRGMVLYHQGVRLISYDRPGYGGSERLPDRRVADVAQDVAAIADALGVERFGVVGRSGGGPHALACAARLGERVSRCATAVCPAPFDAEGLDWFAGMSALNVEEFTQAVAGEAAYRPLAERLAAEAVAAAEAGGPAVTDDYELPESDRAALAARSGAPDFLFRTRAAYIGGLDGTVDDMLAFVRPWGFAVTGIEVPVAVWFGPEDVLCPRAHADWLLAHIPGADPRELPGGHMLGEKSLREVYRWLLEV
jgi:pimeloyl-ACP methyl ester carboxylesterase